MADTPPDPSPHPSKDAGMSIWGPRYAVVEVRAPDVPQISPTQAVVIETLSTCPLATVSVLFLTFDYYVSHELQIN